MLVASKPKKLEISQCSDLMTLKTLKVEQKISVSDNQDLFLALNKNLSKGSIELRKATLQVLNNLFETMTYSKDSTQAKVDHS